MKKSILSFSIMLLMLLVFSSGNVMSQWAFMHPSPTSNHVTNVAALSADRVVITDDRGSVHLSLDGGTSWSLRHFTNTSFGRINFTDNQYGWIPASNGTLLRTSDGGMSWEEISSCSNMTLTGVSFPERDTGWAVGTGGRICKTTDGGQSWTSQNQAPTIVFTAVQFVDTLHGFAGGYVANQAVLVKTEDGGENWTAIAPAAQGALVDINFTSPDHGAVSYTQGRIFVTNDGGTTWDMKLSGSITSIISRIQFLDGQTGFATGSRNRVFKTTDAGDTWNLITTENSSGPDYTSMYFVNEDTGWLTGRNGLIMKTTDGGAEWVNQLRSQGLGISNLHFSNENSGWALSGLNIAYTEDSGRSWEIGNGFNGASNIHFEDDNRAWLSGANGNLWHTTDRGATWVNLNTGDNVTRPRIFGFNNSVWKAPNGGGTIAYSHDGGETWETSDTGLTGLHGKLFFLNEDKGFAVGTLGNSGGVSRTLDGGETWELTTLSGTGQLWDIYFTDENHGWLTGNNGVIRHTSDGGETWTSQSSPIQVVFYAMHFVDNDFGWMVGVGGTAIYTEDGGQNWIAVPLGANTIMNTMFILDRNTAWAAAGNTVLRYGGDDADPVSTEPQPDRPQRFALHQNYPNPFNPSTTIRFTVDEPAAIRLAVYDMLGRRIALLADGRFSPGEYNVPFDASRLSSGMYLYRLESNGFSQTRKMMLVK